MIEKEIELAVIGGGPAGLAGAIAAKQAGIDELLIMERNNTLGGILSQCIHDGFGLEMFNKSLTGPEYMEKYISEVQRLGIPYLLNSMVTDLTSKKELIVINGEGVQRLNAKAVILAMGCREQTREGIGIPGTRPAGIFTAGAAQYFVNVKNYLVGTKAVILGSGDIGLIMARRLTLEGAKVLAVVEKLPYPSGLPRNVSQCLEDYEIPLMLSHTIIDIKGEKRITGVRIARVDHRFSPIPKTEIDIDCDTLILSVGLIPENELSRRAGIALDPTSGGPIVDNQLHTTVPGIFAAGNVLHVHDIVDWVSTEAVEAGKNAAQYIKELNNNAADKQQQGLIKIKPGDGIKHIVPQLIKPNHDITLYLRVKEPGKNIYLELHRDGECIKRVKERMVHPAIMIRLDLEKDEIAPGKELTIELGEK
jgi:NADPH-dependent 2,4-dienoyl-CoA reductase/sulfur reductase-like enzyme